MGFWEAVSSVGDSAKRITPDLSTVKSAYGATYRITSAAAAKINQAVGVDSIPNVRQYWPDAEARAPIGLFTTTLAKNTARYAVFEGFKHIPGATVASKLVSDTMREVKQESHKGGMNAMQAKVDRLEKDLKKVTSQPEGFSQNRNLSSENAGRDGAEKTKDIVNVFMKTEFVGNRLIHDLMIPKIARFEKKNDRILFRVDVDSKQEKKK